MTYAPPTLNELVAYWRSQGGVNLGVVGDTAHIAKGYSYHLGADHLAPDAYSARTSRDIRGLSNAASAMDLGKLDGSFPALRLFSSWLVDQARKDAPGTSDMREIIYSPDGATVLRWDRERGYASAPQGGEADTSHLTHTHVSWYRDAEERDHTTAFRAYFEPKGDDVSISTTGLILASDHAINLPTGTNIYDAPVSGAPVLGKADGQVDYYGAAGDGWKTVRVNFGGSKLAYTRTAATVFKKAAPPPADCSAVEAELADLNDRVDTAVKILEGG